MHTRDYRDILGGAILILIGVFAAVHALTSLRLGTLTHMGPGMFPAALGCILAVIGVAILVPAMFRTGDLPAVDLRSFLTITLSLIAFGFMIEPFGLVPAVVVLMLISSRADSKLSMIGFVVLATILSVSAALIFHVGLEVPMAIIAWPW